MLVHISLIYEILSHPVIPGLIQSGEKEHMHSIDWILRKEDCL